MTTDVLEAIRRCFAANRAFYTSHARHEMLYEERGSIVEQEIFEAVADGQVIESYPDDTPYPSFLILGFTTARRPLHAVCAYNEQEDMAIVVTIYEPDPALWERFRRRRV